MAKGDSKEVLQAKASQAKEISQGRKGRPTPAGETRTDHPCILSSGKVDPACKKVYQRSVANRQTLQEFISEKFGQGMTEKDVFMAAVDGLKKRRLGYVGAYLDSKNPGRQYNDNQAMAIVDAVMSKMGVGENPGARLTGPSGGGRQRGKRPEAGKHGSSIRQQRKQPGGRNANALGMPETWQKPGTGVDARSVARRQEQGLPEIEPGQIKSDVEVDEGDKDKGIKGRGTKDSKPAQRKPQVKPGDRGAKQTPEQKAAGIDPNSPIQSRLRELSKKPTPTGAQRARLDELVGSAKELGEEEFQKQMALLIKEIRTSGGQARKDIKDTKEDLINQRRAADLRTPIPGTKSGDKAALRAQGRVKAREEENEQRQDLAKQGIERKKKGIPKGTTPEGVESETTPAGRANQDKQGLGGNLESLGMEDEDEFNPDEELSMALGTEVTTGRDENGLFIRYGNQKVPLDPNNESIKNVLDEAGLTIGDFEDLHGAKEEEVKPQEQLPGTEQPPSPEPEQQQQASPTEAAPNLQIKNKIDQAFKAIGPVSEEDGKLVIKGLRKTISEEDDNFPEVLKRLKISPEEWAQYPRSSPAPESEAPAPEPEAPAQEPEPDPWEQEGPEPRGAAKPAPAAAAKQPAALPPARSKRPVTSKGGAKTLIPKQPASRGGGGFGGTAVRQEIMEAGKNAPTLQDFKSYLYSKQGDLFGKTGFDTDTTDTNPLEGGSTPAPAQEPEQPQAQQDNPDQGSLMDDQGQPNDFTKSGPQASSSPAGKKESIRQVPLRLGGDATQEKMRGQQAIQQRRVERGSRDLNRKVSPASKGVWSKEEGRFLPKKKAQSRKPPIQGDLGFNTSEAKGMSYDEFAQSVRAAMR